MRLKIDFVSSFDELVIVTCFESEVNHVSFGRELKSERKVDRQQATENIDTKTERYNDKCPIDDSEHKHNVYSSRQQGDLNVELNHHQQEKKKKTKTLSDVISRIKKEPVEMTELTRELFEKKNDGSKKDSELDVKSIRNIAISDHFDIAVLKNSNSLYLKQNNSNDVKNTILSLKYLLNNSIHALEKSSS